MDRSLFSIAALAALAVAGLALPGCGERAAAASSAEATAVDATDPGPDPACCVECEDCKRTLALVGGPCPKCVAKYGGDAAAALRATRCADRPNSAQRVQRPAGALTGGASPGSGSS